ncbi:ATP-binding protein [Piscinibacter sp. XHJ-5]|uniref:ATP-binding protein n=1 Tax=Piscinibacter sp. XHJ-5 TaxID=3037797 RepID=UPI002452FFA6|nr:ATP-binding protein [Piscinibacter sp. XHJ-5]
MKRLWRDTLFKRLFILMWVALVGSHLVAFALVTKHFSPGDAGPDGPPPQHSLPTLPSLPPTPGLPDDPRTGRPPDEMEEPPGPRELPAGMLVLDYGVRLAVIGLAAWWGARWLSRPMQRLVDASRSLGPAIGRDDQLPQLDERRGTFEVREASRVFNDMARQLNDDFKSRGLLAAAISHDLRTPLTRVRMRLETLESEPAAQRCIADVREMNQLIDTVLDVFRGHGMAEAPKQTDVCALAQSLADDLVEQGHAVTFRGGPARAKSQPAALRRALANLIENAVRYGDAAQVSVASDDGRVRIVVEDRGPGIPEAQLDAVFRPFHRVDASRSRDTGGIGLGLYIARDLLQRQGGTVTVANRDGGGLRATIELPAL